MGFCWENCEWWHRQHQWLPRQSLWCIGEKRWTLMKELTMAKHETNLNAKWGVYFHRSSRDWSLAISFFTQEPKCKDGSEYFDSRMDNFTTDTLAPSQLSALLWSPGSSHVLSQRSESTNAVSSDALRQNIYENFMRELEMSRTNLENTETSSETEDSSGESLSSLEQLDLLYEKEQGVVRKAGWLFFKPLVTLQKEKKLELVTRRKWKQYWVTLKGKPPCCSCGLAAAVAFIASRQLFTHAGFC